MDISTLLCEVCIPCLKFASCIFNVVFPPGWTQAVPVVFMLPQSLYSKGSSSVSLPSCFPYLSFEECWPVSLWMTPTRSAWCHVLPSQCFLSGRKGCQFIPFHQGIYSSHLVKIGLPGLSIINSVFLCAHKYLTEIFKVI